MSVTTLYSNKTRDLFEERVFKYTAGMKVIGEKGYLNSFGFKALGGGGGVKPFLLYSLVF
jgi:hypothetical protein